MCSVGAPTPTQIRQIRPLSFAHSMWRHLALAHERNIFGFYFGISVCGAYIHTKLSHSRPCACAFVCVLVGVGWGRHLNYVRCVLLLICWPRIPKGTHTEAKKPVRLVVALSFRLLPHTLSLPLPLSVFLRWALWHSAFGSAALILVTFWCSRQLDVLRLAPRALKEKKKRWQPIHQNRDIMILWCSKGLN